MPPYLVISYEIRQATLRHNRLAGFYGPREDSPQVLPAKLQCSYRYLTLPHKVLLWPSICTYLMNSGVAAAASDLQHIAEKGTPWFVRQEMAKHVHPLIFGAGLPSIQLNNTKGEYSFRSAFPTLTVQLIQEYTDAYFNTFHVLCPILNQDTFMEDVALPLVREGYPDGDPNSVLALMVFALGQIASEGVFGPPVTTQSNLPVHSVVARPKGHQALRSLTKPGND